MTANGFSPSATVDKPMDQVYCLFLSFYKAKNN